MVGCAAAGSPFQQGLAARLPSALPAALCIEQRSCICLTLQASACLQAASSTAACLTACCCAACSTPSLQFLALQASTCWPAGSSRLTALLPSILTATQCIKQHPTTGLTLHLISIALAYMPFLCLQGNTPWPATSSTADYFTALNPNC